MEIISSSETVRYIIIHIVQGFKLANGLTELDVTKAGIPQTSQFDLKSIF